MLIKIIIILVSLYLLGGICKVINDFRVSSVDKPLYARRLRLGWTVVAVILWLPMIITYIRIAGGIRNYLKAGKGFGKRRNIEKFGRIAREDPSKENYQRVIDAIEDSKRFDKEMERLTGRK